MVVARAAVSFLTFALAASPPRRRDSGDEWLVPRHRVVLAARSTPRASPVGYWLKYACAFLDAVPDEDRAHAALASLRDARSTRPRSRPTVAPRARRCARWTSHPGRACRSRALVSDGAVEAHLDAVEREQQEDGGWMFDWLAWSPEQTSAWRGIVTIRALVWLRDNGRSR